MSTGTPTPKPRRFETLRYLRSAAAHAGSATLRAARITRRITPLRPGAYSIVDEEVPSDEKPTPMRPGAYSRAEAE